MLVARKVQRSRINRAQFFSKKAKSRFTWLVSCNLSFLFILRGLVAFGAFALWKSLDWLNEYLDQTEEVEKKEKIVVLGSGFAALSFLQDLNTKKFDVTVVSPRSYFLYTPLLCDGAVGSVAIERYNPLFFYYSINLLFVLNFF
jgi:hypothetical protein